MANVTNIKITSRTWIPGQGLDANGNIVRGKTRVVGSFKLDDFEELQLTFLGLKTLDHIDFAILDTTASLNNVTTYYTVNWLNNTPSSNLDLRYPGRIATTAAPNGGFPICTFEAYGDATGSTESF